MVKGLVSTIIPVFNRPQLLLDAVKSVLDQSYHSIEIIIVNDGSTDSTQQIIDQLCEQHSQVTSVTIENSGPAVARQTGLSNANGEFIQFLDSDDLLNIEKFSKQVEALNQHQDCGVSYCIQEFCDESGKLIEAAWMRSGEHFNTMFPAMLGGRIWGTPVPLYRAKLLGEAGPWKDLKNQEDWEYDCRIASLGVKLHYLRETMVTIRRHDSSHFGQIEQKQTEKLRDKALSYLEIYKHAKAAKISKDNLNSKRFNRMAFMLLRECASSGLEKEARELYEICVNGTSALHRKIEYYLYFALSNIAGWQRFSSFTQRVRG